MTKNFKGSQGDEKKTVTHKGFSLGYQKTSQQKFNRPGDGGNDIQNFERLKTFIKEYSIKKSYHSDMKDEIKAFPDKQT